MARLRRLIDIITILGRCRDDEYVAALKDKPQLSGCQALIKCLKSTIDLFIDIFVE